MAEFQGDEREFTSESHGNTFKKLLCVAFDLAVVSSYSNFDKNFYRFVYHDGIFESLDNTMKNNFIKTIKKLCEKHNIQYIFSMVDSDSPRDNEDNKIIFEKEEVVITLTKEEPLFLTNF